MDPVLHSTPGRLMLGAALAAGTAWFMFWVSARPRHGAMDWRGHVQELRRRILISASAVGALSLAIFSFRWPAGQAYPEPALHDNLASQAFGRVAADLVPAGVQLVVIRPIDGFLAEMTLAIGIAVLLASPLLVGQAAGFVLPALHERERAIIRHLMAPVLLLFLLGATFAYTYVLPFLLRTLYGYGDALGAQPLLQVSELIGFTVGITLVMGAAFQTPVVMYGLTRAGLVAAQTWAKSWRHALVAIMIVSALVTDPTVLSQIIVAAPLALLYAAGVVAARLVPRPTSG